MNFEQAWETRKQTIGQKRIHRLIRLNIGKVSELHNVMRWLRVAKAARESTFGFDCRGNK